MDINRCFKKDTIFAKANNNSLMIQNHAYRFFFFYFFFNKS